MMEGFFLGMKFQDYVASQFDVKLITEGKYAGRVCFKTPLDRVTVPLEEWSIVKNKINEV